jgi:hypothetical protein
MCSSAGTLQWSAQGRWLLATQSHLQSRRELPQLVVTLEGLLALYSAGLCLLACICMCVLVCVHCLAAARFGSREWAPLLR